MPSNFESIILTNALPQLLKTSFDSYLTILNATILACFTIHCSTSISHYFAHSNVEEFDKCENLHLFLKCTERKDKTEWENYFGVEKDLIPFQFFLCIHCLLKLTTHQAMNFSSSFVSFCILFHMKMILSWEVKFWIQCKWCTGR